MMIRHGWAYWVLLSIVLVTAAACDSVPEGGDWEHAFDDDVGWQLSADAIADVAVVEGALVVHVFEPGQVAWAVSDRKWSDLHVTVEATQVVGPYDNEYGVLVHMDGSEAGSGAFYAFSVSGDGYARIARYENGAWSVLGSDWVPSDAINQGEATNVLEVIAEGARFKFAVNGQTVLEAEDTVLTMGRIGLYAGAFSEGGVVVAFDNLRVSSLP